MLGHVPLGEVIPLLSHFLVILAAIVVDATQIPGMEPFCSVYFSNTAMSINTTPTSSPKCLCDPRAFISLHPCGL